jgi:hypothetical protein
MTEYELIDAAASFNSLMQGYMTLYITILSAYLITAYVAGARLTKFQAAFISLGMLIFTVICSAAVLGTGTRVIELFDEAQTINPDRQFSLREPILFTVVAVTWLGSFIGLKVMWDVRHADN